MQQLICNTEVTCGRMRTHFAAKEPRPLPRLSTVVITTLSGREKSILLSWDNIKYVVYTLLPLIYMTFNPGDNKFFY